MLLLYHEVSLIAILNDWFHWWVRQIFLQDLASILFFMSLLYSLQKIGNAHSLLLKYNCTSTVALYRNCAPSFRII